jgi:hypothetical protein
MTSGTLPRRSAIASLRAGDLSNEFNILLIRQWGDALAIVVAVADFFGSTALEWQPGCDLDRNVRACRDANGHVQALFRRNAAEKGEVPSTLRVECELIQLDPVVNRRDPVRVRSGFALGVADRDQRHSWKCLMDKPCFWQILPTVQSADCSSLARFHQRKPKKLEMTVQHVEFFQVLYDGPERGCPEIGWVFVRWLALPRRLGQDRY